MNVHRNLAERLQVKKLQGIILWNVCDKHFFVWYLAFDSIFQEWDELFHEMSNCKTGNNRGKWIQNEWSIPKILVWLNLIQVWSLLKNSWSQCLRKLKSKADVPTSAKRNWPSDCWLCVYVSSFDWCYNKMRINKNYIEIDLVLLVPVFFHANIN